MLWFNPPYNIEVKTNIRKHIHRKHPYKKIFNTNTIKLSYSCTPNVKKMIKLYDSSIINSGTKDSRKDNFPLYGKCLVKCIAYRARVSTRNQATTHFGPTESDSKGRYNNHTLSFRSKGQKDRNN